MAEETNEVRSIDWGRCCAFLDILRGFRMSIHPAKLLLCLLGLAASLWLAVLVDQIPGVGQTDVDEIGAAHIGELDGRISFFENLYHLGTTGLWGEWALPYVDGKTWGDFFVFAMQPLSTLRDLIVLVCHYWLQAPLFSLIATVLSLGVWAYIGGAVTRIAAVRFAREETIPLKQAMGFACRKWPSLAVSPLIPFIALAFVGVLLGVLTGVPLMIPYAGEIVIPLLLGLTLIVGLLMALILVGGSFSVGLQWPTVAAEGSDSFDAISRSVAYISSRPWRYIFYTLFAAVYGCLTFIFVKFVAFLTLWLTHFAVSLFTWGGGDAADKLARLWARPEWTAPWPQTGQAAMVENAEMLHGTEAFGAVVIAIYVWIVLGLVMSYLISFAMTSQTIIYFLLRRAVDSTDVEEVYMEESEEEELPVEHAVEPPEPAPEGDEQAGEGPAAEAPAEEEEGGEDETEEEEQGG
jgi:hypothetical protein